MSKLAIFNLVFPSRYLMAASLLRFQENYESKKFRGKTFSVEEYMDWYAKTHKNVFSYFEDWEGFNFPGDVLFAFHGFSDSGVKETVVRRTVLSETSKHSYEDFYVLGTTRNSGALSHEIAHALFYLNPEYAADVKRLCRTQAVGLKTLRRWLKDDAGYHPAVWADETNAYLLTGMPTRVRRPKRVALAFEQLFKDHFGFDAKKLSSPTWAKKNIHFVNMAPKLRGLRYW